MVVWNKGNKMTNTTYQKIDEISDYLSALRVEFPAPYPFTVREMITTMSREALEKKYAELLLLAQQVTRTSSYTLGREYND